MVTTLCLLNSSSPSLDDILLKQQLAKPKHKQRPGAASVNPLVQSAVGDVGAAKGKWQTVTHFKLELGVVVATVFPDGTSQQVVTTTLCQLLLIHNGFS